MEEKNILKQLKKFQGIEPNAKWETALKSRFQPQETLYSRGILPFTMPKLAYIPATLIIVILAGVLIFPALFPNNQIAEKPETYLVLIEEKLSQVSNGDDLAELVLMLDKASASISDASETAEIVEKVVNINKKINELDLGEDVKESAEVLASKTAELLGESIDDALSKLVSTLIQGYENMSLSNPQAEVFNQAKEYYNNKQFELALETILKIGE